MTPAQRRLLADLLIRWEDAYRQGQDTPADVLCSDDPELAATLARQIAALKRVAWLDRRLEDDGDEPSGVRPDEPRPPKLLAGRYRLDQLIATGGFAEVWRAFDEELQRIIAVKIPKRTVINAAESFFAEARRVARLKHPAIVPIHDVGLDEGECFFVSEYVEGGSLADRLAGGTLPPEQACRWIGAIADALGHAHRSGVIHRDIKPANILVDAHDRALLADFGIAQSALKTGAFAPSLGTLRYMAPEQLDGQAAVPQSDIYSLAVVLHEALVGRPPYSSAEPNTLRREIGSGARISRDVPRRLAPVLRRALDKDPGRRFGSAAEFAAAVRSAPPGAGRVLSYAAVAATAVLLGALAWRSQPTSPAALSPAALSPAVASARAPAAMSAAPSDKPLPTVVRKEMPYPLPPCNRRVWRAQPPDADLVYRFDEESGWWLHYREPGPVEFRFRQTKVTDDGIDLDDPSRQMWVTLTGTACWSRASPTYPHEVVLAPGAWVDESASPYPPELDVPITLISARDTLESHLRNLGRATGVPVTLNVSALILEGITKNQSFAIDAQERPAAEVLPAILAKADREGRLRAVLRATDDGRVAIDITTTRALEQGK